MEISPEVDTPRAGEPITAAWAANLAAAVNSSANPAANVGDVSTPNGKANMARFPEFPDVGNDPHPLPFTVRLVRDSSDGEDHVYVFLPQLPNTMRGFSYVSLYGEFTQAHTNQTIGSTTNGWVDMGAIEADKRAWLVLYFTDPDAALVRPYNTYKWRLGLVAGNSHPSLPADAWDLSPVVVIAFVNTLQDNVTPTARDSRGFFQIHKGFVSVGTMSWVPFGTADQNFCDAIGDRSRNAMLGFGSGGVTVYPDIDVNGKFQINGIQYKDTVITDGGGNSRHVLAQ